MELSPINQFNNPYSTPEEEKLAREKEAKRQIPRLAPEDAQNVIELETDRAEYKIVYSTHRRQNDPNDIEGSDGIILEFGFNYSDPNKVKEIINTEVEQEQQYNELIKYAQEHKTPIYFVDMSLKSRDEKDKLGLAKVIKKWALPVAGARIGYELTKSTLKEAQEKPIDRRSFIKGVGKLLGAAYLSTPGLEAASAIGSTKFASHEPDETSVLRKVQRVSSEINGTIHPELKTFSMEGRNALIAQKAESIAEELGNALGKKPKLSVVIGAMHTGIEKVLKMDAGKRIAELHHYFSKEEIETERTIARVDFTEVAEQSEIEVSFYQARME